LLANYKLVEHSELEKPKPKSKPITDYLGFEPLKGQLVKKVFFLFEIRFWFLDNPFRRCATGKPTKRFHSVLFTKQGCKVINIVIVHSWEGKKSFCAQS
jgi:hypothetical protein